MSARRTTAAWSASGFLLIATCHHGVAAESGLMGPGMAEDAHGRTEHTDSVTLGMLSVKPLGVDRPWDPRVCIGCERNNGPSPPRERAHRYR